MFFIRNKKKNVFTLYFFFLTFKWYTVFMYILYELLYWFLFSVITIIYTFRRFVRKSKNKQNFANNLTQKSAKTNSKNMGNVSPIKENSECAKLNISKCEQIIDTTSNRRAGFVIIIQYPVICMVDERLASVVVHFSMKYMCVDW